jgi:hypothetical protein
VLRLALDDEEGLAAGGLAWTLERPEGEVIGVGGLVKGWAVPLGHRWSAWCFLGDPSPLELLVATRYVRRELLQRPGRIEIDVAREFRAGHRWARLLGFRPEGHAEHFRPDGGAVVRYSRIVAPC